MTAAEELTDAGRELRETVESRTDDHGHAPWDALGEPGARRLAELGRPLVATVRAHGAFPDGVFARRR